MRFRLITPLLIRSGGLLLVFFLSSNLLWAQSDRELKKDQERLRQKIALTTKLLHSKRHDKDHSLARLKVLQSQKEARTKLVASQRREVRKITQEADVVAREADVLSEKRDRLAKNYQDLLQASYRTSLTSNRWIFLLSAASFHQMFQRWRYLKRLNQAWKKQLEIWHESNAALSQKLLELNSLRDQKQSKLVSLESELTALEQDQKKVSSMVKQLAGDEKKLTRELENQKRAMARLRKAIEASLAKVRSTENTALPMTPAMKKLADSFVANKGKLPWPVKQGLVSRAFGTQPHPTLRQVKIKNNGLDIRTLPGSAVKNIFGGEVIAHEVIPGFNHMLIISHGNYYTVYSHLENVIVGKGDELKNGETLGFVAEDSNISQVHIEIWKGKEILNPEQWLAPQ